MAVSMKPGATAVSYTHLDVYKRQVLSLLRKFSDGGRMNFSQRYRYNEMAQRYACLLYTSRCV